MNAVLNNVRTDVVFTDDLTIEIHNQGQPVIIIRRDGTVQWRGREVETDDEFKAAVMDFMLYMQGKR